MNKVFIIGCDEVGYGSLAGPLVVCGVKAPRDWTLEGLNDSKKLSDKKRRIMRDKLSKLIEDNLIELAMSEKSNIIIDRVGVYVALKEAHSDVVRALGDEKSSIIIDGNLKLDDLVRDGYDLTSVVKADTTISTVMAASIIAKVYRDDKMKDFHLLHPMYDWDNNVGYGSAKHIKAIKDYGLSPLHRRSYKIKSIE